MWLFAALVVASVSELYVPARPGGVLRAPRPAAAPARPVHLARGAGIRLELAELAEDSVDEASTGGVAVLEDAADAEDMEGVVSAVEGEEDEEDEEDEVSAVAEEEEEEDEEEEAEEDAAASIEDADEADVVAAVEAFEAAADAAALPEKERLSASAEASLAAALISALAVLGIDIASFGVVENLEAAVAVGALALSQVDSAGPVGETLRAVGGVSSAVVTKGILPAAKAVNNFVEEKEVGLYTRALLEIGLESLILKARESFNPERAADRKAEAAARKAAAAAEKAAAEAAARQDARDKLPFWDPEKYKRD